MRILVIGASGHVGRAAVSAFDDKDDLIEVGRTSTPSVDITSPESIRALFDEIGEVDAVICAAGSAPFKTLTALSREDYIAAWHGKVLSQVDIIRLGMSAVKDHGSFTLTTGVLAREPILTGAAASLANGAVEAFVRAAAPEMPRGIRINAVSPSVLEDAPGYHSAFPGFPQVTSREVGQAFIRSVKGIATGQILHVG